MLQFESTSTRIFKVTEDGREFLRLYERIREMTTTNLDNKIASNIVSMDVGDKKGQGKAKE